MEATDAESLLDQFEEAASTSDAEATEESPKKTSNIYKAVKNHFAASGQANPKRNPRIGNNLSLYNANRFLNFLSKGYTLYNVTETKKRPKLKAFFLASFDDDDYKVYSEVFFS